MKRTIVLVLLLISANGFGQGFRGFSWGASPQEVMRIEGIRSIIDIGNGLSEIDYLYIPGETKKVMGYEAIVTFRFGKNGLVMGEYFIQNKEMAFYSLSKSLEDKYGPSKTSRVSEGELEVKEWITRDGTTRIELAIVAGRKIPPLVTKDDTNKAKSVRLRYFDEKTWGPTHAPRSEKERPEL